MSDELCTDGLKKTTAYHVHWEHKEIQAFFPTIGILKIKMSFNKKTI